MAKADKKGARKRKFACIQVTIEASPDAHSTEILRRAYDLVLGGAARGQGNVIDKAQIAEEREEGLR